MSVEQAGSRGWFGGLEERLEPTETVFASKTAYLKKKLVGESSQEQRLQLATLL